MTRTLALATRAATRLLKSLLLVALALAAPAEAREVRAAVLKAPRKPVITADANTVAHVYFDGKGLRDAKGNAWAMQGTVPQVAKSPPTPAGAGVFSDVNHYTLGTGSDLLDFSGDFSLCVVFSVNSIAATSIVLTNGKYNTAGWYIQLLATTGRAQIATAEVGNTPTPTTANGTTSGVNVVCVGRATGTTYAKLNGGTIASGAGAAITPATSHPVYLGRYTDANYSFQGVVYEVWASTTTPSDALFSSIQASVKAKLGITAW